MSSANNSRGRRRSVAEDKPKFVVSEHFAAFARLHPSRVVTYTEFLALAGRRAPDSFVAGQGLHDDQRMKVARHRAGVTGAVVGLAVRSTRAHKHQPQNVLLSDCTRDAQGRYSFDLLLDDRCEQLSDHQTGTHIAGMVIKEAFRQAFLVLTETYFLAPGESSSRVFVTRRFRELSFDRFLFPLPATVVGTVTKAKVEDRDRLSFSARFETHQADQLIASTEVDWLVLPASSLDGIERTQAKTALAACAGLGRKRRG